MDAPEDEDNLGKSMIHSLNVLQYANLDEVASNSKRIKPKVLAIIKLHLSEGISQSVNQLIFF